MELWDLYTIDKEPTGKTMVRGEKQPEGYYNLVVSVWIRNREGKYLISQRSASKRSCPLMWEAVAGGVISGETSVQGAVREVKEEIGMDIDPSRLRLILTQTGLHWKGRFIRQIADVYLYVTDEEYDAQNAVSDEVAQSRWMTADEIRRFIDDGRMIPTLAFFFDEIEAVR